MQIISDSETLTVNDLTCTYAEYRQLPNRDDRIALRNRMIDSLVEAYRRNDDSPIRATHRFPCDFEQDFIRWEASVETPMDELKRRIAGHDWYYDRSDDHGAWTRGKANLERIQGLIRVLGPEAQVLYTAAVSKLRG